MTRLLRRIWNRFLGSLIRKRAEADLAEELNHHMRLLTEDHIRRGLPPDEAWSRARAQFGSVELTKDRYRDQFGFPLLDGVVQDVRHALRGMRKNPGFAAVAVLSVAIGIGANTAIFGVFEAVMLRLLPVRNPSQLVFVQLAGTSGRDGPPYPLFERIRDEARSFESVSAFSPSAMELTADRGRELARGVWVSGNLHEMLGVRPLAGRTLRASDDQTPGKGGPDGGVAVISRAYWQQRFGADPAVVGRTLYLYGHAVTIVGVMPTEVMTLEPGYPADIAVPMMLSNPDKLRDRTSLWLLVVARLKPGVRMDQARAEANALFDSYMADVRISPDIRRRLFDHIDIAPAAKGLSGLRRQFSKPLTALTILAGLVLLAACVNLCNLMLARVMARQREFSVRLAIGAGRGRLIRQAVAESVALVGVGTVLGLVFARLGQTALAAFFAEGTHQIVLDLSLNARVLLFTIGVAMLSALGVGILPARRAAGLDPAAGLRGGSRGIAGSRASMRLGRALVLVQVSLSMVLLAGAGLFVRSLRQLESVDLGFDRESILTMEVAPERALFGTPEWLAMQADILERVRQIPGVRSAGWATMNPMSGRDRGAVIEVEGFARRAEADEDIHLAAVSPQYFDTLAVPILLGRGFTVRDHGAAWKVAMLNEAAARFYFGNASPLGRRVRFTNYPRSDLVYEIVGVVKDTVHDSLREQVSRFIYVPVAQSVDRINRLALAVRCTGDAAVFAAPVRRLIQDVQATLLISNISSMEKQVERALLRERLVSALSTTFGAVALALASIGLYGILAYSVTRRANEIAIRMALGASRGRVVWLVTREAFALAGGGIVIGVPLVLAVGSVARATLYGVEPLDLPALLSAALLLLVCAGLAASLPGRRASVLDPATALRRE
jgi:predicted permease